MAARTRSALLLFVSLVGVLLLIHTPAHASIRATQLRAGGIDAYFTSRSYPPRNVASLRLGPPALSLTIQVFRCGAEAVRTQSDGVMNGVPVTSAREIPDGRRRVVLWVGDWPSGLYFARLNAASGRVGYAPFIVRPRRLGEHRVAVVLPTNTWQAYNFRDEDGNGLGDSWYTDPRITTVSFARPYLNRGVPSTYRNYDAGFLRWLAKTARDVDVFSQEDIERVASGDALARAYDLIVFPGHHEYVARREFDAIERYRNLGGNLAFLSANNFFYRVVRTGQRMTRVGKWRDVGRPEAALVGVQYLDWNEDRYPNTSYLVSGANRAPWLFRGTGLRNGSRFGVYGIEIDQRTAASPPGTEVLAVLPDIFGPGRSAEMTYYQTTAGARVFAAGSINFGGSSLWPITSRLLENLWARLVPAAEAHSRAPRD